MKPSALLLKLLLVGICVAKARRYVRNALQASCWTKAGQMRRTVWLREARGAALDARYFASCWTREVLAA